MNINITIRVSEPTLSPYSSHDSMPSGFPHDGQSEAIGGKGGYSAINFGGLGSTSRSAQDPLPLGSRLSTTAKTVDNPQCAENDVVRGLEKLLQKIQAMLQNAMQKPGGNGKDGVAGKEPAHTPAPTLGAGAIESTPAGRGPLVPNTTAAQNVPPAQVAAGTQSAGGLHLPAALTKHEEAIGNAADASGMPANVIAGMIWAESRGDSSAGTVNGDNGKSDSGLMQVNSATAAEVQSKYPQHFTDKMTANEKNIMTGALYLKDQSEAFGGDIDAALRAYNSGPNTVNVSDPRDISKTGLGDSNYVIKVHNFAETIGSGKGQLPA
jgi:hypothetical protein